jgi:curli biogenesis system outer membrane secretion channel CsgG
MTTRAIWIVSLGWVGLLIFLLSACASVPVTPTPAPTGSDYQQACLNLAALECPIGSDLKCEATLQMETEQHLTNIDVSCLKKAATKGAAVACGGVSCQ